jgi:large repetitive protein
LGKPTQDGKHAYVGNAVSGTVSVIAIATNKVVATITLAAGSGPFGVAITPDGKHVYVANSCLICNVVSVIDTATNTVVGLPITLGSVPFWVGIISDDHRRR